MVLNWLNKMFNPDLVLGRCSLSVSFSSMSQGMDRALAEYVLNVLEHGLARSYSEAEWRISPPRYVSNPSQDTTLPEYPIFHAIADNALPILGVIDWGGGIGLRCGKPVKDLAKVKLLHFLAAPNVIDSVDRFYWGVCPSNPDFAKSRNEQVWKELTSVPHEVHLPADSSREYFTGRPRSMFGIRIASFLDGFASVAMPQYFLDSDPKDSDPALLVEGDHSVLIEMVKLEQLIAKIRSLGGSQGR